MDDKKLEDITNLLESLQTSGPAEELIARLQIKVASTYQQNSRFSKFTIWGIAASFLILLISNIILVDKITDRPQKNMETNIYLPQ
jgi:hypothetical protein